MNNPVSFVDGNGFKDEPIQKDYKGKEEITDPTNCGVQNPGSNCASYTLHNCESDANDPGADNERGGPGTDNNPYDDLSERGYKELPFDASNKVGDIVVYVLPSKESGKYSNTLSEFTHIGTVTAVDKKGNTTEVESKFGAGLPVYKHHPRDVKDVSKDINFGPQKPYIKNSDGTKAYFRVYYRKE